MRAEANEPGGQATAAKNLWAQRRRGLTVTHERESYVSPAHERRNPRVCLRHRVEARLVDAKQG